MSLKSMSAAIAREQLSQLASSIFVKRFVYRSIEHRQMLKNIESLSEEEANEIWRAVFESRYRTVHDIAIAMNEFIDLAQGAIPLTLDKEVTWDGYINGTEAPVTCVFPAGTQLYMLEFLEAPAEGFIFQLTYGEGPEGKHFNLPMDEVLMASQSLVELIQKAQLIRVEEHKLDGEPTSLEIEDDTTGR